MPNLFCLRFFVAFGIILVTLSFHSPILQAQQLEEIIVTAQRREQSLQEVPISIETYTSAEIRRHGYRDLEQLGSLVPGIIVLPQQDQTEVKIRGFGTTGNSLTLEVATPVFLDGIHFGRMAQAKLAYLDIERIEILKGPQPVFFGNNAIAGAFNIQTKRPTATWEGDTDFEVGNNNTQQISFGVGGPINDTWGIRLAGKYETTDGYLIDAIDQQKFPHQEDWGGRLTLQWTPSDNLTVTSKVEYSDIDAGSEGKQICLNGKSLVFGRRGPLSQPGNSVTREGEPFSIWADPLIGEGTDIPHLPIPDVRRGECFDSNVTRSNEGPYFDVPTNIRQTAANTGMLDIREAAQAWTEDDSDPLAGPPNAFSSILGGETMESFNALIDVRYSFANGIELDWLTGHSKYARETSEENFDSPFYENNQIRNIDFDQWSTELRAISPTGGMIEWMAGVFIQDTTMDVVTGNMRATVRRGQRMNNVWEDVTWYTAFGTVTLNFMDDRASIDLGGRVADIDKLTFAGGLGRQWVVNEEPEPGSAGGYIEIPLDEVDQHSIYLPFDPAAGLWYYPFRANRNTPENWKGTVGANVVGLTMPFWGARGQEPIGGRDVPGSPVDGDFGGTEFDPQVVLRFRPTDNHSVFARWAQSFKLGGFDTGQTTIPDDPDDFAFDDEHSETFEFGSKGTLLDGQARYTATLFQTTFSDLQLQVSTGTLDDPNANVNAGKQRVRGAEFTFDYAVTEFYTVSVAGAIMDGTMVDFFNAPCNRQEALTSPDCILNIPGDTESGGVIDRTGQAAPFTPDWGFTMEGNYIIPVFDRYEISLNARGFISDGYFVDSQGFTKRIVWDTHGDVNLSAGFGDAAGSWRVAAWARNILEANKTYFPELDATENGGFSSNVSPSNFMTYGLKFEYSYR
jgi:outer membrane receptor protein involved in Fe transport